MSETKWRSEREQAIHLLRSGHNLTQVSQQMNRSIGWVHKWKKRYETEGWSGLSSHSRHPHRRPHAYPLVSRHQVCHIRSELEAQASQDGLCFIGAPTIRAHLLKQSRQDQRVPSISTIERILVEAGLTHPKTESKPPIRYPRLLVTTPHHVHQLDIVPHHLAGGQAVACFNALDVFSRYPTGQTRVSKTSADALQFLLKMWQDLGIATYTQMDNEGCFSGGNTHRYVIGKVVRLCLMVGTQAIFIPIRHPKTNAIVERFHQTYDRHVWLRYYLDDPQLVNHHASHFFETYRQNHYHSAFNQQTPQLQHASHARRSLPDTFAPNLRQLPITAGHVHFVRRVESDGSIPILNHRWLVSLERIDTGVWATIRFSVGQSNASLSIYDQAPDQPTRQRLAYYPVPLPQTVVPLSSDFTSTTQQSIFTSSVQRIYHLIRQSFTMF